VGDVLAASSRPRYIMPELFPRAYNVEFTTASAAASQITLRVLR
jgi:hypothetical protein